MTSTSETPDTTSVPETSATTNDVPAFGWSGYAERVNGRFAMVGFVAVLLIEVLSGDTFLHWRAAALIRAGGSDPHPSVRCGSPAPPAAGPSHPG